MNESLSKTLRELRLSGMAESLEVRLQEATSSKLTHLEFLELVLADECLVRNDRKIDRGVRRAGFRDVRRLEDFDFSFNRSIERAKIFELASGHFLRGAKDVLMCGPPGTGKPQPPQYPARHRGMRGRNHGHGPQTSAFWQNARAFRAGNAAGTRSSLPR